jgi:hypothetical protein
MSTAAIDALHDRYRRSFAGRPRSTRDIGALDAIIADAERLSASADGAGRAVLDERIALYRRERTEIAEVQSGGPEAAAAWRLVEWSRVTNARYLRTFAGQSRLTRDLGLLDEIAQEERARLAAFPATTDARLVAQRQQIASNADLYAREAAQIRTSRAREAPTRLASLLATLANAQFAAYRAHFQGQSRGTRREAALQRIVGALDAIRAQMETVRDLGVRTDAHLGNLAKVTDRVAHFRGELEKIRAARASMSADSIARALGDDANAVFRAYRAEFAGQSRATRDADRLAALCDGLHEIARTMDGLVDGGSMNTGNLGIVLDQLASFEREHARIREAKPAP